MKTFFYVIGQLIAYVLIILAGMAAIIALGYLLGCIISVKESRSNATDGVCTSTLCQ